MPSRKLEERLQSGTSQEYDDDRLQPEGNMLARFALSSIPEDRVPDAIGDKPLQLPGEQ